METIKAGKPVIEIIKLCYRANRPPLLVGQHGVGKSELLEQAAKELGIDYLQRDLSLMEPPDLLGLPVTRDERTEYLPPAFLPRQGKGLLVIEELNRAERFMQAPCLQLLTARTLNDYQLPSGWLPVAAINPDESDYAVTPLDPAILSRFAQVEVIPDVEEWSAWAAENRIHSKVLHYVKSDPSVFDHPDSNPRAWSYISDLLHAADDGLPSDSSLHAAVLGTVGDKRGTAFLRTLKQAERPLTVLEILQGDATSNEKVNGWIETGRIDLVDSSLRALFKFLQPEAEYEAVRADADRWASLTRFLSNLPGDQQVEAREFFRERGYLDPCRRPRRRFSNEHNA